jgi:hypothetical protein
MKNIAVFHHCRLDGGEPPIDDAFSLTLLYEQMAVLETSGLSRAARFVCAGITASEGLHAAATSFLPLSAEKVFHPEGSQSELPTLSTLQKWLPGHEDWYVLYTHAKGVTRPNDLMRAAWRSCMTRHLVSNWRQCVSDLDAGYAAVGCHWVSPEKYPAMAPLWATYEQFPGIVRTPYFGGNWWWSKASYLMTLPTLPENATCKQDFFLAESWIGMGPRRPLVMDYHADWPTHAGCLVSSQK